MDGEGDVKSHCDDTHVDDDYKLRCELVNLATTNEFGEVEIINENIHGGGYPAIGRLNIMLMKFMVYFLKQFLIVEIW